MTRKGSGFGYADPQTGKTFCRSCHYRIDGKPLECCTSDGHKQSYAKALIANSRTHRQLAASAIEKYGGVCSCCGETEPLFLEIDHVNNDGDRDRQRFTHPMAFYRELRDSPVRSDLQVLCSNCNQGKRRNGGMCPHDFTYRP